MFRKLLYYSLLLRGCTESFRGLRLDPDGFYLVLLPLGIRWVLLKYHDNEKPKVFAKTVMGMICFHARRDYMSTLEVSYRT